MSSQSKRLATLKQRFDSPGKSPASGDAANNTRKRHSVYIDQTLMQQVDELFKETRKDVYPVEITKSAFLEQLLEQGIQNIDKVKIALAE